MWLHIHAGIKLTHGSKGASEDEDFVCSKTTELQGPLFTIMDK